jgi:hypothetical protein
MGVSAGKIAVCLQATALWATLAGCTYYKGEEYFDPFGVLERQGGESRAEYESRKLWQQIQAAQAATLQSALPGGVCPGGVRARRRRSSTPTQRWSGRYCATARSCPGAPAGISGEIISRLSR